MKDFFDFVDEMKTKAPVIKDGLVEEAMEKGRPVDGVKFLKGLKEGFPDGFTGTVDQSITNTANQIVDDAIKELRKKAMSRKWSD